MKKIEIVLLAVVISLLFVIGLHKYPDLQRYMTGMKAEINSENAEEEMEIRKRYYEKLEIKRSIKPSHWTDGDEEELKNLEKAANLVSK